MKEKLFGSEEINTGRQIEADMAKFVGLVGLVLVHCFETFVSYYQVTSTLQFVVIYVLDFIFGAGTFMFCMGVGIAYSRHNTPARLMKRGLKIFLQGYVLNLACALCYLVLLRSPGEFVLSLIMPDIMQFAGLALLLFGFLRFLRLSDAGIGAAALALSVLGTFFGTVPMEDGLASAFLGLFVGVFNYEYYTGGIFPLVNWFIFVAGGYLFGQLLRRCTDKGKLYRLASGGSALILAVYLCIAVPGRLGMMGSVLKFHHLRIHEAAVCLAGAVFALGLHYALSHLLPGSWKAVVTRVSRSINTIYCLQWVIISWTAAALFVLGRNELSDAVLTAMGLGIFLLCAFLARIISGKRKNRPGEEA